MTRIDYLDQDKFIDVLAEISSKQNVLSGDDLEDLAISCTNSEVISHNQLVDRSIQRAYEIMSEFEFEYDVDNQYFKLRKIN